MHTITWNEQRDYEGGFAIWDTECGQYRIVLDPTTPGDCKFVPKYLRVTAVRQGGAVCERQWVALPPQATWLDAAQAINQYHCKIHDLVLA